MLIGTSQNGWPVYDETSHYVKVKVSGCINPMWAANSDVAVILTDYAEWFHANIEPLDMKVTEKPGYDDWSYAVRPIRGQTKGYSNHGSATAWDLNSTQHPRGVKGTFTKAERDKMKSRELRYDGAIRLGEFYTGTIDGMHVEINVSAAKAKTVADKIRKEKEKMPLSDKDVERIADAVLRKNFARNLNASDPNAKSINMVDVAEMTDKKLDMIIAAMKKAGMKF